MRDAIDKKIQNFFSTYPIRHYNQRHILIYTEDTINYIYYLQKGKVKQYAISKSGDEHVLNVFKERSFFPVSHAINKTRSKYLFEAEDNIAVYIAPAKDVLKFLRTNPDVLYDLLSRVYKGTEGILGRMEQLMSGTARSRLVYELVLEAYRFGEKIPRGGYTVQMSEKTIASRSGLTRETVNRVIHDLKEQDLIDIHRNHIIIRSIHALEKSIDPSV